MARLLLESTMSILDSKVRKNGHCRYMSLNWSRPPFGSALVNSLTAAPKPYQPGSIRRHWAQLNTQGIARKSSIAVVFLREAGREPMFSVAISVITVEAQK